MWLDKKQSNSNEERSYGIEYIYLEVHAFIMAYVEGVVFRQREI